MNPFGEKASNSPPHGGSDKKPFRFPAQRENPLTSHAPSLAQCCLGLSLSDCGAMAFQVTKGCRNLALPAADCALSSFLKAEAAPAESDCVAREGIFARRAKTNLPMCLRRCESSSLGRFAERVLTCLDLSAADVPCKTAPFTSFSGRGKRKGPRGLSAVQFFLPLSGQSKKQS